MKMRWKVTWAAAVSAALLWLASNPEPATDVRPTGVEPVECAEDDPCWDCETMGNLRCGVEGLAP